MTSSFFTQLSNKLPKQQFRNVVSFIEKKPLISFLISLGVLLGLIMAASVANKPVTEPQTTTQVKEVSVYRIGTAPKVTLQAKIEKASVLTIVAQSAGVVQQIYAHEGQAVDRGTWIVGLSTNYQGGNIASLQRQLAQKNYDNTVANFDTQKDLIGKQREIANKTDENADKLREIANTSLNETKDQLSYNESLLGDLDTAISQTQAALTTEVDPTKIETLQGTLASSKQLRSQLLAGVNQLKQAVRNSEYQVNENNPPTQLANLQKDITLKQLDMQEKGLDLSKEIGLLNLRIAQIGESLMYPAAPFSGQIERVFVKVGQTVAPGTPIALLSGTVQNNTAIVRVPADLARQISPVETSTVTIGTTQLQLAPSYISNEATDGQLYSVMYTIPVEYCSQLTDGQYLSVDIPVGYPNTGVTIPFVPLDAVTQTQNEAILYLLEDGKVVNRTVQLGSVMGRFVQVKDGLQSGDQVILNRNVITGDLAKAVADQ